MADISYLSLNPEAISNTINGLHLRIAQRFSNRGITNVSQSLSVLAESGRERAELISRPIYFLRVFCFVAIVCLLLPFALLSSSLKIPESGLMITDFIQSLEAGINDVVLIGAGIYFLFSLERRIKRTRALKALDELRSLAHIIDMHQLSKDPERYLRNASASASEQGDEALSLDDLIYYLDYCSEMLSLVGKIAALYAAKIEDEIVLQAVNEIESLTTSMARKIWQKIMILNSVKMA